MSTDPSRILHVDDEADMREIVKLTLETLGGFRVTSCASGGMAVEAAVHSAADLAILDVMMPAIDGPSTLGLLRDDGRTRDMPIVFMTAKGMPSEVARLRALGAVDVIAKPFDPMMLCERVREAWHRHKLRATLTPVRPEVDDPEIELGHLRDAFAARAAQTLARLETLRNDIARGDRSGLAEMGERAHKLAGTGAMFGFPEVSRSASLVEEELASEGANFDPTSGRLLGLLLRFERDLRAVSPQSVEPV